MTTRNKRNKQNMASSNWAGMTQNSGSVALVRHAAVEAEGGRGEVFSGSLLRSQQEDGPA